MRQSFYVGIKTIIERDGEVLLVKDTARDTWEIPGGRIDQRQGIVETAERELGEELPGAKLKKLGQLVHAAVGDFMVENDHRLCLLFFVADVVLQEVIELSPEHSEYTWISEGSLENYDLFASDKAALVQFWHRA